MIQALCNFYAYTVAAVWSGIGFEMLSSGNVIFCADSAVRIEYGCLSLRAVLLVGLVGLVASVGLRQAWPFPTALAIGAAMSWLRCFTLVAFCFRYPAIFERVHGQCGYAVFLASALALLVMIFRQTRCLSATRGGTPNEPRVESF